MQIKSTYVTLKQAKLFKEKGFDEVTDTIFMTNHSKEVVFENINRLKHSDGNNPFVSRPEQWQVVEWLRVKHDIWITPVPRLSSWIFNIVEVKTSNHHSLIDIDFYGTNDYLISKGISTIMLSPQEACSEALDYVLNNLI